jgi:peptidoglycan lytic transglycosylase
MRTFFAILIATVVLAGLAAVPAQATPAVPAMMSGSHYHSSFDGRRTACGDRFDQDGYTAASNRLPCDALVRVSRGARSVVVRVTDRCGRCGIDLSLAAAREIGLHRVGRAPVKIERVD